MPTVVEFFKICHFILYYEMNRLKQRAQIPVNA